MTNKGFLKSCTAHPIVGTGKTCYGFTPRPCQPVLSIPIFVAFELRNWQVLSLRFDTVLSKPIRAWAGGIVSIQCMKQYTNHHLDDSISVNLSYLNKLQAFQRPRISQKIESPNVKHFGERHIIGTSTHLPLSTP